MNGGLAAHLTVNMQSQLFEHPNIIFPDEGFDILERNAGGCAYDQAAFIDRQGKTSSALALTQEIGHDLLAQVDVSLARCGGR